MDIEKIQKGYVEYLQKIAKLDRDTSVKYLFKMVYRDMDVVTYMDHTKTSLFEVKDTSYFKSLAELEKENLGKEGKTKEEIDAIVNPLIEYGLYVMELVDDFDYQNYGKRNIEQRDEMETLKKYLISCIKEYFTNCPNMKNKYEFVYDYEKEGFKDLTEEKLVATPERKEINAKLENALKKPYEVKASFNKNGQLFLHVKYSSNRYDYFEVIK